MCHTNGLIVLQFPTGVSGLQMKMESRLEKLIEHVRHHQVLFNISNPNYMKIKYKQIFGQKVQSSSFTMWFINNTFVLLFQKPSSITVL